MFRLLSILNKHINVVLLQQSKVMTMASFPYKMLLLFVCTALEMSNDCFFCFFLCIWSSQNTMRGCFHHPFCFVFLGTPVQLPFMQIYSWLMI